MMGVHSLHKNVLVKEVILAVEKSLKQKNLGIRVITTLLHLVLQAISFSKRITLRLKDVLSGLRRFKMMKNAFLFTLKALFVLKIF